MRADRLISIMMLLQSHERMTADELSEELEVSSRTIYRDVLALNMAGIPIYTDRGPGGGIALLDSYKTTLTGMNADETRALFMMSIPQSLIDLGVGQNLKSALFKLAAALPRHQIEQASQAKQRIYLDSTAWKPSDAPMVHLETLHRALWMDRNLKVQFQGRFDSRIELEITPLGLVSKMNNWFLLGKVDGYIKVIEVKKIIEVFATENYFVRDEEFNLTEAWNEWCRIYRDQRQSYLVRVKVSPELADKLSLYLGNEVKYDVIDRGSKDPMKWSEVNIIFENLWSARNIILSLGRAVEVLEPIALRRTVIDFARQIVDLYQE